MYKRDWLIRTIAGAMAMMPLEATTRSTLRKTCRRQLRTLDRAVDYRAGRSGTR
jgi:hypothetical protein